MFMKKELPHHLHLHRTFGQRASDFVTKLVGSWFFIGLYFLFLACWVILNIHNQFRPWDPYPFIFLNLVLAVIAALQAPVILMSQNREAHKNRLRAEYDYAVNRKAEKEIEELKSQLNRIEKKLR